MHASMSTSHKPKITFMPLLSWHKQVVREEGKEGGEREGGLVMVTSGQSLVCVEVF